MKAHIERRHKNEPKQDFLTQPKEKAGESILAQNHDLNNEVGELSGEIRILRQQNTELSIEKQKYKDD